MNQREKLKPIDGFEKYMISDYGNVISLKTNITLHPTEHNGKQSYYYVSQKGVMPDVFQADAASE